MPRIPRLLMASLLAGSAPAALAEAPSPNLPHVTARGDCELGSTLAALGRLAASPLARSASKASHAWTVIPAAGSPAATPNAVVIKAVGAGAAGAEDASEALLRVTCDGVAVLGAPVPGRVVRGPGHTIARGAHATSLDFDAGALFAEPVQLLVTDDGGLSLTLGPSPSRVLYSRALRPDGELVEREDTRIGCGCTRVTTPDGRQLVRP